MKKLAARDFEDLLQVSMLFDVQSMHSELDFSAQFLSSSISYLTPTMILSSPCYLNWPTGTHWLNSVCTPTQHYPFLKHQQQDLGGACAVSGSTLAKHFALWNSQVKKQHAVDELQR